MTNHTPSTLIVRGREAYQRKDWDAALDAALERLQSDHQDIDALELCFLVYRQRNDIAKAADILTTVLKIDSKADWAYNDLIRLLFAAGHQREADKVARKALQVNPYNAEAHDLFGTVLSESNDLPSGEWHFRRALELTEPQAHTHANLALNLMQQGRTEQAQAHYAKADKLLPNDVKTLAHWSKLYEVVGDLTQAEALLQRAEASGSPRDVNLLRASYLGRRQQPQQALEILNGAGELSGHAHLERGRLYDRLGRYDEAWQDFVTGKEKLVAADVGLRYNASAVTNFFTRLKAFFVQENMDLLPQAASREEMPQPIFIVGFPRSGTTLIEQVLTAHPGVRSGGELPFLGELRHLSGMLLPDQGFPDNLAQAWTADKRFVATLLRDYYLARSEQYGLNDGPARFFTDKMPFNEIYIPLLRMAFPRARIIHVVRHPLDVCVSIMANNLTHGFNCGYRIEDVVHHLAAVFEVIQHYWHELEVDRLTLCYETFVANQHDETKRLLDYLQLPFDSACMRFHETRRYAPTPSYAQVSERLNNRAVARYKNYISQLQPFVQQLTPLMSTYAYSTND